MKYPEHLKEDIRSRIDLVDFISHYLPLKKSGATYKALCPFHQEKTPSFTVTPSKGIFHCFGCGKGGDIFTFLMEKESLGFFEAFEVLAREAGIDLSKYQDKKGEDQSPIFKANQFALNFYFQSLKPQSPAYQYFTSRGISHETIQLFKLGYAPAGWDSLIEAGKRSGISISDLEKAGLVVKHPDNGNYYDRFRDRIIFPIYNLSGLVIAFGARTLKKDEKGAKYLNSPESSVYKKGNILYGLHVARSMIRQLNSVIVVEGYMDFHSLFQAGISHVVASSGTALTSDHASLIRRYAELVYLIFDGDSAGIAASNRGIEILAKAGLEVRVVTLPSKEDPDSYVQKHGAEAFNKLLEKAEGFVDFKLRVSIEKHGIKTPEANGKIIADLAQNLTWIPNEVIRDQYIKMIYSRLKIRSGSLERAMGTISKSNYKIQAQSKIESSASSHEYDFEKDFLALLIQNPILGHEASKLFETPEIWPHPGLKTFFEKLIPFLAAREKEEIKEADLLSQFTEKERRFITQSLEVPPVENPMEEYEKTYKRLQTRYYKQRVNEKKNQMKSQKDRGHLNKEVKEIAQKIAELDKTLSQKDLKKTSM